MSVRRFREYPRTDSVKCRLRIFGNIGQITTRYRW